jgi:hypothetical protein
MFSYQTERVGTRRYCARTSLWTFSRLVPVLWHSEGIYDEGHFIYDALSNTHRCEAPTFAPAAFDLGIRDNQGHLPSAKPGTKTCFLISASKSQERSGAPKCWMTLTPATIKIHRTIIAARRATPRRAPFHTGPSLPRHRSQTHIFKAEGSEREEENIEKQEKKHANRNSSYGYDFGLRGWRLHGLAFPVKAEFCRSLLRLSRS